MFVKKNCSDMILIAFLNAMMMIYLSNAAKIICRGDKGHPVDWYIVFKPPKRGDLFYILDNENPTWKLVKSSIAGDKNPLADTLSSIYTRKVEDDDSMYAMYNDQVPSDDADTEQHLKSGHTKGVINFDQDSGFWMIHSVPKFPPNKTNGGYAYPKNGFKFGQMFFCLSLSYKYLDDIAEMFLFNKPHFYDFTLPQKFNSSHPNLAAALEGKHLLNKDLLTRQLTSLRGQKFMGFAKSAKYGKDLWSGIANSLKSSLTVESWRNNASNMPSLCKYEYTVENIRSIQLLGRRFNSTHDHSKWAVSKKSKTRATNKDVIVFKQNEPTDWSCIGDINRQCAQVARGGGAVCFDHPLVAVSFQKIIDEVETCPTFI